MVPTMKSAGNTREGRLRMVGLSTKKATRFVFHELLYDVCPDRIRIGHTPRTLAFLNPILFHDSRERDDLIDR
jgi:hypothetical protein